MKRGVIVGRFQVPELHEGHKKLIDTALAESDRIVIVLGAPKHGVKDARNPYSLGDRHFMLMKEYSEIFDVKIVIRYLFDRDTNEEWSEALDKLLENMYSEEKDDILLYHSRDSFKDSYSGKYPLREVEEVPGISGTKVREQIK